MIEKAWQLYADPTTILFASSVVFVRFASKVARKNVCDFGLLMHAATKHFNLKICPHVCHHSSEVCFKGYKISKEQAQKLNFAKKCKKFHAIDFIQFMPFWSQEYY